MNLSNTSQTSTYESRSDLALDVRSLTAGFVEGGSRVPVVENVSFWLRMGESLGLVGESGSGKSVTCLSLLGLFRDPGRFSTGEVVLGGRDVLQMRARDLRRVRGAEIAMILQDPLTSLNPAFTVGFQLRETIALHQGLKRGALKDATERALREVGFERPEQRVGQYPHELSGGMRQRVAGAIALSCRPRVLVADEPTTALDTTVQAQYLALIKSLQAELGYAMVFVSHDIAVVSAVCDRIAVMYGGRVVEQGPVWDLLNAPAHPYTRALLDSLPQRAQDRRRLPVIAGQPPSRSHHAIGCVFASRCPVAIEKCRHHEPPSVALTDDRSAACWLLEA